ncbi:MAG TPA: DUF58 domain-containing protein [Persephonella sp.]|uniref:Uncharacterized protein n=1 Tax=Persephonella marina (strain DSM 14350 / EX-H1) TaxID=123214 RepID=C0QQF3_PERMH|nr:MULTISPECIES: DUF58 domain-containing protein [Persephonella]ACO04463.1 conserved hypothetical protein [Persephonella marina EX-H1]HCB69495.1 DUF58 domain-containing protein [Persephonella sp.]
MIVSAMLAFMGVSGFAGKRNISSLDLEIQVLNEIYAKNEGVLKIKLKNNKRFLPSFILSVELFGKKIFVPFVESKGEFTAYLKVSFPDRGVYRIERVYICSVFPFNFFKRCTSVRSNTEFYVFPKPERPSGITDHSRNLKKKGEITSDKKGYEGDIISIREYRSGDPLKYIHWKASAKTGKLKTKELGDSINRPVIVDIDRIEGDIERKVSCATYLVLDLYKRSIPFGLKIENRIYRPEFSYKHKIKILRELAVYGKN